MADADLSIKNVSVSLFAFHLCHDLTQAVDKTRPDANQLWQQCANLSPILGVKGLAQLPDLIQTNQTQFPAVLTPDPVSLLKTRTLTTTLQLGSIPLKVEAAPFKIHDTYALDLTLHAKDAILQPGDFSTLNPNGCLLSQNFSATLGQTILLYAEPIGPIEQDQALADACVTAFLQGENPHFSQQAGHLFGSSIFEYDNWQSNPATQIHLLVCLNRHPNTLNLLEKHYFSILGLLLTRSKILCAYHNSEITYTHARAIHAKLEEEVKQFQTLSPLSSPDLLVSFKAKLANIPEQNFSYAYDLRSLQDHLATLDTNRKNYDHWLNILKQHQLTDDNLDFLSSVNQFRSEQYQSQLHIYLNFLTPGSILFGQMIEAIRGRVEIEEADQDLKIAD
jgi:hypothetical protein